MKKIRIAFLIPMTSNGREWKSIEDSYFYQFFLRTLIGTTNSKYLYRIYLVVDFDDKLFSNANFKNLEILENLFNIYIIKIINNSVDKGHLTKLWNMAFKKAYIDGCEYFYQCGDDIQFLSFGWLDKSIKVLNENKQIGITGPIDLKRHVTKKSFQPGGAEFLQTQTFVSRKHMDIFGYYFPEELKNWFCDNWITKIYYPDYFYKIDYFILNKGGKERYKICGSFDVDDPVKEKCEILINKGKEKLTEFIK